MANYKNLFMRHMDRNDIKYTDVKENVVKVSYTGDNLQTIPIYVFFDKDGDPLVSFKCWNIANFKGKEAAGIMFYIDDDADVITQIDSYVDEENCGSVCLSLVRRMVNIIDETYPDIMRTIWGS